VYPLGARRTPPAPHTSYEPFSPGTYLTLFLRHAIAQAVDIQSFVQPVLPAGSAIISSSTLRREIARPRAPRPRDRFSAFRAFGRYL
jgi:hypothetical protein